MVNPGLANVGIGCSCCTFILCLFAASSPYWIWSWGYSSWGINTWGSYEVTMGTGVWTAGYASSRSYGTGCGGIYNNNYYACWSDNWVRWSSNLDAACTDQTGCIDGKEDFSNNINTTMTKYGMCEGGSYDQPAEILALKWMTTIACITSGFAVMLGFSAMREAKMGFAAAGCVFIAGCLMCASFSVYVGWDYAQAVRSGSAGLILESVYTGCEYTTSPDNINYGYGPAFGSAVTAFVLSLFTAVAFIMAANGDSNMDGPGAYGGGKFV